MEFKTLAILVLTLIILLLLIILAINLSGMLSSQVQNATNIFGI